MKKKLRWAAWLGVAMMLMGSSGAMAADADTQALLEELRALKTRVETLEKALEQAQSKATNAERAAVEARETSAHSLKMSEEMQKTKTEQGAAGLVSDLGKRLKIYGGIEVEGAYNNTSPKKGSGRSESDITLSTAELFIEAEINKYTRGLLHLLYEQDDTDPMNIDEGYIILGQTEDIPAYLMAGRMYPAIGLFETYMVSDPLTQEMFETQASAAEVGWAQDWFNVGVGIYNADVHELGDAPDNNINTFYARAQFDAPEGALGEGVDLNFGVAYTNNIAGGNLADYITNDRQIKDMVGGWSAMLSAQYKWVIFTGEYLAAVDDYQAGELDYADDKAKPYAYSLELAFTPIDDWTFATRYEGADDISPDFPEHRWGLTASWEFLEDTVLSLEYMRGEFGNEDEADTVTTQLAVGF